MNTKTRLVRNLLIVAVVAAALAAMHHFDALGLLRALHGQA